MLPRLSAFRRKLRPRALGSGLLLAALTACSHAQYPQTTLDPQGDFARISDRIQMNTFWWAAVVFVLVEGALLFAIFRFRGKPDDPEPAQVHGNTTLEIIWTAIPALILAMIAVPTVKAIFSTAAIPQHALEVQVVGHQWWWEFRYPNDSIVTANELHVPVGQVVSLRMGSGDVIHSFWIPALAGKRDVFPDRETRLWFTAEKAGKYSGQCAEFCGEEHGLMAFNVVAEPADSFARWMAHMRSLTGPTAIAGSAAPGSGAAPPPAAGDTAGERRISYPATGGRRDSVAAAAEAAVAGIEQPGVRDSLYAEGQKLFAAKGCVGCHSLDAVHPMMGLIGPNLANVGSRSYIAAGTLRNTDANMAHWIMDPQGVKPGAKMIFLGIKPDEAKALVAYLRAHR